MSVAVLALSLLTVALDGGGLVAQDASLRRSILPTAELSVASSPLPFTEISLGYGAARQSESFPDMEMVSSYHRVPLRLGARLQPGRVGVAAYLGPALVVARTRIDDGRTRVEESRWLLAGMVGLRGETALVELPAAGSVLVRANLDAYFRGRRTDVAMMLGVAWRLGGG